MQGLLLAPIPKPGLQGGESSSRQARAMREFADPARVFRWMPESGQPGETGTYAAAGACLWVEPERRQGMMGYFMTIPFLWSARRFL